MKIQTNILLHEDQMKWLRDNRIVISVKVRELLDEYIKERSSPDKYM